MIDPLGMTAAEFARAAAGAAGLSAGRARTAYRAALRDGEVAPAPGVSISRLRRIATEEDDGVVKLVLAAEDGERFESVVIPMPTGRTLCVSTQAGCRMGCAFCRTARLGLSRNLAAAEIAAQPWIARHELGCHIGNLVFMGMGEPLDNADHLLQALRVLADPDGFSFARSAMTVSTCGLPDGIARLAGLGWKRLGLAVSLNASNDRVRSALMPINRRHPMGELRRALDAWPMRKSGVVCIEYVLLRGVNDRPEHALELADYLRGLRTRIHLIPWNPHDGGRFEQPDEAETERFLAALRDAGLHASLRASRGANVCAACGQLGGHSQSAC